MTWQFSSELHPFLVLTLASILAGIVWILYPREGHSRQSGSSGFGSRASRYLNWFLPSLRAAAVFFVTLTLGQPVLESRVRVGEPGSVNFLLDGSLSMTLQDSLQPDESRAVATRYARAVASLAGADGIPGLADTLADKFEMRALRFGGEGILAGLPDFRHDQQAAPPELTSWTPSQWAGSSAIGAALLNTAAAFDNRGQGVAEHVVVLMSDGRSNAGISPLQAAETLRSQNIRVFTVGYGPSASFEDLAAVSVEVPQRVFQSDMLTGTISISENVNAGQPYSVAIAYEGKTLWQQDLRSKQLLLREVPFSVSAEDVFAAAQESLPQAAKLSALPTKLDVTLSMDGERNVSNNQASAFTTVTVAQSRILLIDGRSRWETRYIRNVFSRDPAWEITSDIRHPSQEFRKQERATGYPATRDELFQFDLVVLGDVSPRDFEREQLEWLREFVDRSGGGLVIIDGAREHLRSDGFFPLVDLLPIRWKGKPSDQIAFQVLPTTAGQRLDALRISSDALGNSLAGWAELPPLLFRARVQALPGSEVLLEAVDDIGTSPLMVSRKFGAGKVLYLATDETWKWRYRVADQVHSKVWHQLARWVMRAPYSVQNEFVSLDSGPPNYGLNQPVEIRCQLRQPDSSPADSIAVTAIVRRETEVVARIPLLEDESFPGNYSATTDTLPPGDYSVELEAAGFPQESLEVRTHFTVTESTNLEMRSATCNQALLEEIAEKTGGSYFHESDIDALVDSIRPLSGGRFERSSMLLWQSYGWFSVAILLVVVEWILRKRAGLV